MVTGFDLAETYYLTMLGFMSGLGLKIVISLPGPWTIPGFLLFVALFCWGVREVVL